MNFGHHAMAGRARREEGSAEHLMAHVRDSERQAAFILISPNSAIELRMSAARTLRERQAHAVGSEQMALNELLKREPLVTQID